MKQVLLFCCIICCNAILFAQSNPDLSIADSKALDIPVSKTYSTTSIASYINLNFKTDEDKLKAIYTWVTANIKYDADSMYIINSDKNPEARITEALRRRKGVCENYAAIFNDITLKTRLTSYMVSGYTKQYGTIDRSGHTWCAVYIDNEWFFCDPTWDEGRRNGGNWFLVSPEKFIESHMPFDPLWQLLDHPASHKDFYSGDFYSRKNGKYSFKDSVNAYLQLSSRQQLETSIARIEKAGLANQQVINRLAYLKMQAGIIDEEIEMNLYNATVKDFNNANDILNTFIQYRNAKFIPVKTDRDINSMLIPIDSILAAANKKLDSLRNAAIDSQYDPALLNKRFDALYLKLQEQKNFLKHYFITVPALREKLFYTN